LNRWKVQERKKKKKDGGGVVFWGFSDTLSLEGRRRPTVAAGQR
jgi:hypothetical protein